MSDLLEYIKLQKQKGLDDYTVFEMTKMYGGDYTLTSEDKIKINKILESHSIDINAADFQQLKQVMDGDGLIKDDNINSFDDVVERINSMSNKTKISTAPDNTASNDGEAMDIDTEDINNPTDNNDDANDANDDDNDDNDEKKKSKLNIDTYTSLDRNEILYFPTQDIKDFDDTMLFAKLTDVLNQNKQRSFTIFFTKSEEYARRFSGIWSLNKRNVYVHKLQVIRPINRIKIINSKKISDNINNYELSLGMCGSSIDGEINGIKIEQEIDNSDPIEEYYICNPSSYFKKLETWMQFDATKWIKISPSNENTNTIKVPSANKKYKLQADN